ncbi:MAG TPA: hypothetical protein VEN82_03755, partial [Actinomycetota bacterium]|nr:hypothetical protein [Actinomycetota bacterium]
MRLEGVEGAESPTGVGHRLRRSRVAFYVQRIGTTNRKVASAVPARTLFGRPVESWASDRDPWETHI